MKKFKAYEIKSKIMFDKLAYVTQNGGGYALSPLERPLMTSIILESTGKKDINGIEIFYDCEIFEFEYQDNETKWIQLKGTFHFNEDELRAEIDVDDGLPFVVLWYISDRMRNFKVIGTKFD